jgi:hypothetical protein
VAGVPAAASSSKAARQQGAPGSPGDAARGRSHDGGSAASDPLVDGEDGSEGSAGGEHGEQSAIARLQQQAFFTCIPSAGVKSRVPQGGFAGGSDDSGEQAQEGAAEDACAGGAGSVRSSAGEAAPASQPGTTAGDSASKSIVRVLNFDEAAESSQA